LSDITSRLSIVSLLMGLIVGAAIWLLSPIVTGRREPWDAEGGYYAGALFAAGLLGGLLFPRHSGVFVAGIFLGQVLVLLAGVLSDPASGGLWPLGVAFLGLYTLLALLGSAIGSGVSRLKGRKTP
jgi:hypothetical protein